MKIYVAGHRGLVGSAILRRLKEKEYRDIICRTSKEIDLRRQDETERFFEEERPEHAYMAAARVGGILANSTYKADFIYDNMAIALNVIHSAYKYGVKKLLNLGSSCIFPRLAPQPMKEEYLLTGYLEPTNEPYAMAKISAIKLCRYYNEQHGTNFISVMPANLYGPGDNFNLETAHALPAMIRKFHLAKLLKERDFESIRKDIGRYPLGFALDNPPTPPLEKGGAGGFEIFSSETITSNLLAKENESPSPPRGEGKGEGGFSSETEIEQVLGRLGITKDYVLLWGSGDPYREFLFVDDIADATVFLMESYDYKDIGEFVNIGMGKDMKIKEIANLVRETVGFDGAIKYDLSKPDGMPKKLLDTTKIRSMGWEPKTDLKEGIRKTYEWYINDR